MLWHKICLISIFTLVLFRPAASDDETARVPGPGLSGLPAVDREDRWIWVKVTATQDEHYALVPDPVKAAIVGDDAVENDFRTHRFREGGYTTRQTLIIGPDSLLFDREYNFDAQADGERAYYRDRELFLPRQVPHSLHIMFGSERTDQRTTARALRSNLDLPGDVRADILLGLRAFGNGLPFDAETRFVVIKPEGDDRDLVVFEYVDPDQRTHRWTCDTARNNVVTRYVVWDRGWDPAERNPLFEAEVVEFQQVDDLWVPRVVDWVGISERGGWVQVGEAWQRHRITLDAVEFVDGKEEIDAILKAASEDGIPALVETERGEIVVGKLVSGRVLLQ